MSEQDLLTGGKELSSITKNITHTHTHTHTHTDLHVSSCKTVK